MNGNTSLNSVFKRLSRCDILRHTTSQWRHTRSAG